MKALRNLALVALCCSTLLAWSAPTKPGVGPGGGGPGGGSCTNPPPTDILLKIMRPVPFPVWVTHAPTTCVAGVALPAHLVDSIVYASSTGADGVCNTTNVIHFGHTNLLFRTPPIPLSEGSNLVTITAIPVDEDTPPATRHIMIHRIVVTNARPHIITRPHRLWGTNDVYTYTLEAIDPDGDTLSLQLETFGPVAATVTDLDDGKWLISAVKTATNLPYFARARFRALVSDGVNRPARQRWAVRIGERPEDKPDECEKNKDAPDLRPRSQPPTLRRSLRFR